MIRSKSAAIWLGLGDEVDAAEQGRGDPAHLGHLPVGADSTAVALELAPGALDRAPSCSGVSCWLLPSVSRMACRWVAPGTAANSRVASVQPGAHRRAAVGRKPVDRGLGLGAGRARPSAPWRSSGSVRVGQPRLVAPGDDREPHAVEHLVQGGPAAPLGGGDVLPAHRAGRVDDDDLGGVPRPGLPRLAGAGAGDGDDGVHVGAAVGQELVLVDVS